MRGATRGCLTRRGLAAFIVPLITPLPAPCEESSQQLLSTAFFTAGDSRFLQPWFDDIKRLGVQETRCGQIASSAAAGGESFPCVAVSYDAARVSYKRVLGAYLRGIDPTSEGTQFGVPGPSIIWVSSPQEREVAAGALRRLDISGLYKTSIVTEIRERDGSFAFEEDADATGWYTANKDAYNKALKKTGRSKFYAKTYDPVTVTACEKQSDGGTICGYVYFPCTEENGCKPVLQGTW